MKKGSIHIEVGIKEHSNVGELHYEISDNLDVSEIITILSELASGILVEYAPSSYPS